MDPATNTALNGAQHANRQYGLLDGIQSFAGNDTLQSGEDLSRFFDPELFESTAIGNGFSQPSMSIPQDFEHNTGRQSTTPEIHQYNAPQHSYGQSQYAQSFYNPPQLNQPSYDPRFFSRPSASPVEFDSSYPYQSQIDYNAQHFNPQQLNVPQRQSPTLAQNYPARQQQSSSPFLSIASRPSQLSQVQVRHELAALSLAFSANTSSRITICCALPLSNPNRSKLPIDLWIPPC